jgi:hypothetical protein
MLSRLLLHVASICPGSLLIQKVNWHLYKTNHKLEGLSSEFRILWAVTFLVLSQTFVKVCFDVTFNFSWVDSSAVGSSTVHIYTQTIHRTTQFTN